MGGRRAARRAVGDLRDRQLQEHRYVRWLLLRPARRAPVQPAACHVHCGPTSTWRSARSRIEVVEPLVSHRLVVERSGVVPTALRSHLDRRRCRRTRSSPTTAASPAGSCRTTAGSTSWGRRRDGWGSVTNGSTSQTGSRGATTRGVCVRGWAARTRRAAQPIGAAPHRAMGSLFIWIAFRAGRVAGQFQTPDRRERSERVDRRTPDPRHRRPVHVTRHRRDPARHHVRGRSHRLLPRSTCRSATDDGRSWDFDATPLRPPWDFSGSGYSGGWDDGAGLGVARGVALEADEYDMSAPADVRLPDGSLRQHWHRETDVALVVDGPAAAGHR